MILLRPQLPEASATLIRLYFAINAYFLKAIDVISTAGFHWLRFHEKENSCLIAISRQADISPAFATGWLNITDFIPPADTPFLLLMQSHFDASLMPLSPPRHFRLIIEGQPDYIDEAMISAFEARARRLLSAIAATPQP